jgi:ABC-type amino acid transport substrate-binding protein
VQAHRDRREKEELKLADLKVTFVPLTSADRLDAIVKNKADIECGATTITLSRAEKSISP